MLRMIPTQKRFPLFYLLIFSTRLIRHNLTQTAEALLLNLQLLIYPKHIILACRMLLCQSPGIIKLIEIIYKYSLTYLIAVVHSFLLFSLIIPLLNFDIELLI